MSNESSNDHEFAKRVVTSLDISLHEIDAEDVSAIAKARNIALAEYTDSTASRAKIPKRNFSFGSSPQPFLIAASVFAITLFPLVYFDSDQRAPSTVGAEQTGLAGHDFFDASADLNQDTINFELLAELEMLETMEMLAVIGELESTGDKS